MNVSIKVAAATIFVLSVNGWRKSDLAVDLVCLIAVSDLDFGSQPDFGVVAEDSLF